MAKSNRKRIKELENTVKFLRVRQQELSSALDSLLSIQEVHLDMLLRATNPEYKSHIGEEVNRLSLIKRLIGFAKNLKEARKKWPS